MRGMLVMCLFGGASALAGGWAHMPGNVTEEWARYYESSAESATQPAALAIDADGCASLVARAGFEVHTAKYDRRGTVVSPAVRLSVNAAPTILSMAPSTACLAGETAYFSVHATGTPPLNYQWNLEGLTVPGADGAAVTLTNRQFSDAGAYCVVVTNAFGAVTSRVSYLSVVAPVTPISRQPTGLDGGLAVSASLGICLVGESGIARYDREGMLMWQVHEPTGKAIAIDRTDQMIVTGPAGTAKLDSGGNLIWRRADLIAMALAVDQAGNIYLGRAGQALPLTTNYRITKHDPSGHERWAIAYRPSYGGQLRALAVDSTGNVVAAGDYFYTVKYGRNAEILWEASGSSFMDQASAIAVDHAGNIYVSGTVGGGGDPWQSSQGQVTKYAPDGRRLWISCPVGSSFVPVPTGLVVNNQGEVYSTWHMGQTFKLNSRGQLLWQSPFYEGGWSIGWDGGTNLYVLRYNGRLLRFVEDRLPPVILTSPKPHSVASGGSSLLEAEVSGTGPFRFSWRHDGVVFATTTNAALSLTNFNASMVGEYAVQLTSPHGVVFSPEFTINLDLRRLLQPTQSLEAGFTCLLNGLPMTDYLLETSTDLRSWEPLFRLLTTNSLTPVKIPPAPGTPYRFFRATETKSGSAPTTSSTALPRVQGDRVNSD